MAKRKPAAKDKSTANPDTEANAAQPQNFEDALAELQQVVEDLETGRLGLEESLSRFEHGMSLLRSCYSRLNQAEQRVEILTSSDEENLTTAPFAASSTASTSTMGRGTRADLTESEGSSDSEQALF
ncbi:MAG: exodeoxyribonuclease VII small subunit [Planctomycetaceae bacterium]